MIMFETSKHVPKTEKRCCVFKDNCFICANKTVWQSLSTFLIKKKRDFSMRLPTQ